MRLSDLVRRLRARPEARRLRAVERLAENRYEGRAERPVPPSPHSEGPVHIDGGG